MRLALKLLIGLAAVVGALVLLVVVLLATGVVRTYRIPSSAMEPTLRCATPGEGCTGSDDDQVIALEYVFSSPKRGDIVAFNTPPRALIDCGVGGVYVKRLIGMPGETWAERDGAVYIDGKKLDEPYLDAAYADHQTYAPQKIPAGQYFMMGDNRSGSCDSRRWGTVPRSNLIGRVVATYWPLSRITTR